MGLFLQHYLKVINMKKAYFSHFSLKVGSPDYWEELCFHFSGSAGQAAASCPCFKMKNYNSLESEFV